jgi:hypothetical protein
VTARPRGRVHPSDWYVTPARRQCCTLLSALALLSILSGCCKSFGPAEKLENEAARPWLTESPRGQYDWTPIVRQKPVLASNISRAEDLLQSAAVVRITGTDAQELVGELIPHMETEAPYLLRAVSGDNRTFPLEVYVRPNGNVWVGGGANSKCPVPMRRQPIVAWLEKMPQKLSVTFYVNRD